MMCSANNACSSTAHAYISVPDHFQEPASFANWCQGFQKLLRGKVTCSGAFGLPVSYLKFGITLDENGGSVSGLTSEDFLFGWQRFFS